MILSRGPPSSMSKLLQILLVAAVVGIIIHLTRLSERRQFQPAAVHVKLPAAGHLTSEERYLSRIADECKLTNETSWLAWRVQYSEESTPRKSMTNVQLNFKSQEPKIVDVQHPITKHVHASGRMELPVSSSPLAGQVDASDFLFGVSTTYARIMAQDGALIQAWTRWLTNGRDATNGASMVVMLDQANDAQVDEIDQQLQAVGMDAYVTTTEEPMSMARRYYELARILKTFSANLEANGQKKIWFGLIEDTIFFPSLSYLLDRLYSYNTATQLYIGVPSEQQDWQADQEDGNTITTAGGGAVFLTRSSLTQIPRLSCFNRGNAVEGPVRSKHWDVLLQECITKHTDWQMHVLPGFYAPNDAPHKASVDSYETGQQPLLLHQAEDRHDLDASRAHLVTNLCGEACFMQRYVFHDNWVLVNGVSVTEYPDGLHQAEGDELAGADAATHLQLPDRYVVNTDDEGDRSVLTWTGRKNVWRFADAAIDDTGAVWQAYVKKADPSKGTPEDAIDSVIVLAWENEVPRRR
ncbi:hypothetical protein S40293_11224 [Stachybotrys chartarum IBT 40293]|nr:hypothetical protein S40293_11224 [Stachybotrys chartarum IBT 40293]KFA75112.1 hypothetical protein S40288_10867 [Stachybotrys chartarum IBT 40288]